METKQEKAMSPYISFHDAYLRDPAIALEHEWLDTNGLGAYASSTIIGCNTRKYHGLLVSPAPGTDRRYVFLSRFETTLHTESGEYPLSTNQYPGVLHPEGYRYAIDFSLGESPRFRYEAGGMLLDCRVIMRHEHPSVLLCYNPVRSRARPILKLRPLLAYRDFNATASENGYARMHLTESEGLFSLSPYDGLPAIYFQGSSELAFTPSPDWYRNTEYLREYERGYEFREDVFSPGYFTVELKPKGEFVLQASIGKPEEEAASAFEAELQRRRGRSGKHLHLWNGADHFLITAKRAGKPSIIAGFPWFDEWGRDAMIALPGLTLCRNKPETALEILESFAAFEKNGLFPNQLHVYGGSSYNTVDASLWFFWAAQMYVRYSGETERLKGRILDTMRRILAAYVTGQVPDGTIREDGLLDVGTPDTQLTWMDVKVNGIPVTPRFGRPVEINALWINALYFYVELSDDPYAGELAFLRNLPSLSDAFIRTFWLEAHGYLADVVYPDNVTDASIRPNQIFAVSLPYSPLSDTQAKRVVDTVEKHLLTPFGLRSLTPTHANYAGRYRGSQESRDAAYHQGTVWPWLIGHFVEAYLRIYSGDRNRVAGLRERISPLLDDHPNAVGLGSISEVFDGDEPHNPGGCPMQAWSVAEVLRAAILLDGFLK